MKHFLILTNSADPDEMHHHAAFQLGLHCLPKYLFRGFQYTKGKMDLSCNFIFSLKTKLMLRVGMR